MGWRRCHACPRPTGTCRGGEVLDAEVVGVGDDHVAGSGSIATPCGPLNPPFAGRDRAPCIGQHEVPPEDVEHLNAIVRHVAHPEVAGAIDCRLTAAVCELPSGAQQLLPVLPWRSVQGVRYPGCRSAWDRVFVDGSSGVVDDVEIACGCVHCQTAEVGAEDGLAAERGSENCPVEVLITSMRLVTRVGDVEVLRAALVEADPRWAVELTRPRALRPPG